MGELDFFTGGEESAESPKSYCETHHQNVSKDIDISNRMNREDRVAEVFDITIGQKVSYKVSREKTVNEGKHTINGNIISDAIEGELDYLQWISENRLPNKEAFTYHIEQLAKWGLISEELREEIEFNFKYSTVGKLKELYIKYIKEYENRSNLEINVNKVNSHGTATVQINHEGKIFYTIPWDKKVISSGITTSYEPQEVTGKVIGYDPKHGSQNRGTATVKVLRDDIFSEVITSGYFEASKSWNGKTYDFVTPWSIADPCL